MSRLSFELNGHPVELDVREDESLLDTLRERLDVTSPKNGCEPQGQCGACTVWVDGHAKAACVVPVASVSGKRVVTVEGLDPVVRESLARAFVGCGALQCGFCTPGFVMGAAALLERHPDATRADLARGLDGHLCRCTGYVPILDALEAVARSRRGEPLPEPIADGGVGVSLGRVRGAALALGQRAFVDDLRVDGMLHGAVVLSEHARARVVAIDTTAALALPGVRAVVTAADVPGERWYGLIEADWPGFVAVGEEVRCVGDFLAAVAADDVHIAREAAARVRVTYEVLPGVLDPEEALTSGPINPRGSNVVSTTRFTRGDVDAALAVSAHVVTETFRTQRIEHLFLEPESALCVPTDRGLHLYTQGQGIFDDQRQVSAFLGRDVFVELVPNGGAFGGKEDLSIQPHAALLAHVTGRPVKLTLTREQSIRVHPKRHPIRMTLTVGCDREGRLTAVRARMLGDTGAYASVGGKVLERAAGHATGAYAVPNVDIEAVAARTNNPPCGAMRGFGANQATFAIEGCLDRLGEELGLDGWELRWRNALTRGAPTSTGQILGASVGLRETLERVKPGYDAAVAAGRAVGIACGIKNVGLGNGAVETGKAALVVEDDGTISLYGSFTEMGQGLLTVLVQCAVEVTGLPAATFRPKVDATFALGSGQTTGSRGTLLGGRAVVDAAGKLAADLREASLSGLVGRSYTGEVVIDDTTAPGADVEVVKTHTTYGFATQVCILDEQGRVERFLAAHDVGRAINPALCAGQVRGAVHMGLGFALSEELPCVDGMPVSFKLRDLGVLRARDMPEVEVFLVEAPEPEGPFGAKGVGEIGLVPTAGAVAGALARFDGIHRTVLPMKDSPAGRAMHVGHLHDERRGQWR